MQNWVFQITGAGLMIAAGLFSMSPMKDFASGMSLFLVFISLFYLMFIPCIQAAARNLPESK